MESVDEALKYNAELAEFELTVLSMQTTLHLIKDNHYLKSRRSLEYFCLICGNIIILKNIMAII